MANVRYGHRGEQGGPARNLQPVQDRVRVRAWN